MRSTRRRRRVSRIFPAAGAERFDRKEYGACPGPLAATQAVTHGLYLKPGRRSVHTLYAVHHGDRESIEVFEVNAKSTPPAVTWIGCVVVPDPVGINSVAALPDGGFVLTNFDPRQPPPPGGRGGGLSPKLMAGEQNGEVWEWHAKSGWAKVPGSEAAGANGIEVSRDGKWLYVAQWGKQSFVRLSRGKTPVERQEIPLGFRTDNIRWAPDGKTLIVAGQGTMAAQPGAQRGRGQGAQATVVVRVNPQTMTYRGSAPPGPRTGPVGRVGRSTSRRRVVGGFISRRSAHALPGKRTQITDAKSTAEAGWLCGILADPSGGRVRETA